MSYLFIATLSAVAFASPRTDSARAEYREEARQWVEGAWEDGEEGWAFDSLDAEILERTAAELGAYLDAEEGPGRRARVFSLVRTPDELSAALDEVIHRRFGEVYFDLYEWLEARTTPADTWLSHESEHFVFLYRPASPASQDIYLISAVAEQTFEHLTSILEPSYPRYARIQRVIYSDPPHFFLGKILVKLHNRRVEIGGAEPTSGGVTNYSPLWFDDQVHYLLWVDLAYPGSVGMFGIPHELAHSLALLYLADEDKLTELLGGQGHPTSTQLRQAVLPEDLFRLEGWAYMVQYNHSAYVRLGLWRSTRESMVQMDRYYGFPDVFGLLVGEIDKTPMERALGFLGLAQKLGTGEAMRFIISSADLLRYLSERYGPEKLGRFLADQSAPMDALLEVYDLTPYQLQKDWSVDVLGEMRLP